eukprot:Pgem_evm1s10481
MNKDKKNDKKNDKGEKKSVKSFFKKKASPAQFEMPGITKIQKEFADLGRKQDNMNKPTT